MAITVINSTLQTPDSIFLLLTPTFPRFPLKKHPTKNRSLETEDGEDIEHLGSKQCGGKLWLDIKPYSYGHL